MDNDRLAAARLPARSVIASIAGLWLCYYLLITLRSVLIDSDFVGEMAVRRLVVIAAGMVVTAMAWAILRLVDDSRLGIRIAVALIAMIPAAVASAVVNQRVFAPLEARLMAQNPNPTAVGIRPDTSGNILVDVPNPPGMTQEQLDALQRKLAEAGIWKQTTDIAISRYFLLLAWAALYFALANAEQVRAAERREGEFRRAAKAAELRSLRYQVNPHFLFNTLNSLSALVITDKPQAAETMIQTLSTYYRRSLAEDPTGDVSLTQEIEQQQLYLELEAVRFPERLVTRFEIPESLGQVSVPGMILQPLVENSVKYAVAPTSRPVTVALTARADGEQLVLTVSDDGPGARDTSPSGFGIGIANVRDRLAARFGEAATVVSGPDESGGWRTVIRLPLRDEHG